MGKCLFSKIDSNNFWAIVNVSKRVWTSSKEIKGMKWQRKGARYRQRQLKVNICSHFIGEKDVDGKRDGGKCV